MWLRFRARRTVFRLGLVTCLAGLTACGGSSHASRKPADLTVSLPVLDSREVKLDTGSAVDGNLRFTPLAVECGITYLIGTHAEIDYRGQLCRLRLAVANVDNTFHHFDTSAQRLVDTTGKAVAPDIQSLDIKRQDPDPLIGAGDTLIVSLYFALDPGRTPMTIVLRGDNDPSGIGTTVTAPHHRDGVRITIPKQALYKPKPIF